MPTSGFHVDRRSTVSEVKPTIPTVGVDVEVNRLTSAERLGDGVFSNLTSPMIFNTPSGGVSDTPCVFLEHIETVLRDVYDWVIVNTEICR
jgi:hypothetical protein